VISSQSNQTGLDMKISRRPADAIKAGFLLIFLLSGPVLAGQMPDGPITSCEISNHLDQTPTDAFIGPRTDSILLSQPREMVMPDMAALTAKLENLSAAYTQRQGELSSSSLQESSSNCSDPDLSGQDIGLEGQLLNRLDIRVSGISVRAINTVEGGNATATSNIIIEPVQIIELTCEVEERLR